MPKCFQQLHRDYIRLAIMPRLKEWQLVLKALQPLRTASRAEGKLMLQLLIWTIHLKNILCATDSGWGLLRSEASYEAWQTPGKNFPLGLLSFPCGFFLGGWGETIHSHGHSVSSCLEYPSTNHGSHLSCPTNPRHPTVAKQQQPLFISHCSYPQGLPRQLIEGNTEQSRNKQRK